MRPWERRDNPDLRGKRPNGVRRRRLTSRKFGVRSAMSSITAKRQRPDLVFASPVSSSPGLAEQTPVH